jgi:peroxiredoxin
MAGAFMPTCSSQASGYTEKYDEFKAKGINEMYIITVNNVFVSNFVLCSGLCVRAKLVSHCSENNISFFLLLLVLPPLAFLIFTFLSS